MKLPLLSQLTTATRGNPCQEYPGTWTVYIGGAEVGTFQDLPDDVSDKGAELNALSLARRLSDSDPEGREVTVSWQCSDQDPRHGQVWFTGYYQAYKL